MLGERVEGRLTHDLAPLAEWRNPGLGVVLLSDRDEEERKEILNLLPALRAILPCCYSAADVAQATLAVARAQAPGTTPVLPHWRSLQRPVPADGDAFRPTGRAALPLAERAALRPSDSARPRPPDPAGRVRSLGTVPNAASPPARSGQLPSFLRAATFPPDRSPAPQHPPPTPAVPPRSASPSRRLHLT